MTNMTQASATERKGASDLLRFKIFGMPLPLYACALITLLLSHFYNAIPTDLVGGFALMFVMGAIFGEIGKRLPIFNKYIGGAPVMIFLVAAYFVYAGIFTQKEIDAISNVMDKSNFLNLFIAVLITGAILSVNRKLLLKSLLGYIPTILAGIVGASLFGIVIGLCFGIPVDRIMMLYVLPIMGGGNGAGAVPLSEIYHSVNALALIQQQSESHQKVLDFISHNFRDHHLAGLLIGKYYRAKELGLELIFDPSSFVEHLPSSLSHNEWISIVGNLLDNAYNATLLNREGSRQIECLINSEGNEVIIEVADQGCGIDENIRQHIFERGVTTHNNGDHGIGLWLVHSYVKQANGDIIVDNNNPFGTIFTLYIPFTREE
ncbi:GHKL domain-containing protein [Salmonella enterica]|nr:GHKL domain-containing protein [Salmonella enterica]